jgi:hypothetical protein
MTMSLEEYRSAWIASGAGKPLPGELDGLIESLTRTERRHRIMLGICSFYTVAAFLFVAWYVTSGRTIAWNEMLPVLALQIFLAVALVVLIRRRGQRQRALERSGRNVLDAARTGLSHVRSEIRDIRLLALAAAVALPTLAIVVSQMLGSGKMNAQAAWGFTGMCLTVVGTNAVYQTLRYRRKLVPRRERLEQIVASLGEAA